ncbi:hypothetical protein FBZ93_1117 [Bradyrhizobium macuxiense]|uniref:Uncharacterized protein n=1 Tax=Bradyrhizobium macuxiense TaxID=1755647 RepID=A0A560LBL7_9BRAD|nr:hypothetical protein [Bradyrhizobium macuxiense]TWB92968.1 hypothetical protein FBZ93_1117 [Bradyrhizobium macuxiense]
MPVTNIEEQLLSLLASLEECQSLLFDQGVKEIAKLLSLAILEVRMELHSITDSDLKALCDMIASNELRLDPEAPLARPFPPHLKLVK